MKHWLNTHYKTLIITAFLIPIITVAIVSISHVTKWYGISNPVTWAVYLSIGIEIAALSALAAISANMGRKVYFPFAIVTIVQFIGNIYFAYSYIDINSQSFKDWVGLVSPLVEFMGVDPSDFAGHKRFLAFFAGGMLPIISLSFLHMLVQFTEEDRKKEEADEILLHDKEVATNHNTVDAKDIIGEVSRIRLSEEDLKKLEEVLLNPLPPNENLVKAAQTYNDKINSMLENIDNESKENEFDSIESLIKESDNLTPEINEQINNDYIPSLSDEEIMEMNQSEYERDLDMEEESIDGGDFNNEPPPPTVDELEKVSEEIIIDDSISFSEDTYEQHQQVIEQEKIIEEVIETPKAYFDDIKSDSEVLKEEDSDFWRSHLIEIESEDEDSKKKF